MAAKQKLCQRKAALAIWDWADDWTPGGDRGPNLRGAVLQM